jgi:hypothetical protein
VGINLRPFLYYSSSHHSIMTSPTLAQLKKSVDQMIANQGPDAPAAWWIYTNEDVYLFDNDGDEIYQEQEVCEKVLGNLHNYDHIYTMIQDAIEDELKTA